MALLEPDPDNPLVYRARSAAPAPLVGERQTVPRAEFLTPRVSPPAHSEMLPMRADGERGEETHIVNKARRKLRTARRKRRKRTKTRSNRRRRRKRIWQPSWGLLGALLTPLGALSRLSWGPLLVFLAVLRPCWRSWGPLGGLSGPLEGFLGACWRARGSSWAGGFKISV